MEWLRCRGVHRLACALDTPSDGCERIVRRSKAVAAAATSVGSALAAFTASRPVAVMADVVGVERDLDDVIATVSKQSRDL